MSLRDGPRVLEDREKLRAARLEALRADIRHGADSGPGVPAESTFAAARARIGKKATSR